VEIQIPLAAPFACDVAYADGGAIASVGGEVDLATSPGLRRELLATLAVPVSGLTVDLEHVTFIDGSGVAALNAARRHASERGIAFALESVPRMIQRILELAGLCELFGPEAQLSPR
jgi:anti-sigma B factor antagonist